jgi:DNA-binding NarL/FixJ family response regulator
MMHDRDGHQVALTFGQPGLDRPWFAAGSPECVMAAGQQSYGGTRKNTTIRVLVVDDHPVFRKGFVDALREASGLSVCAEAGTMAEALAAAAAARPQVAVVDLSLGSESGLDLVAELARRHPDVRTLVMSGHDESLHADRALKAGALGYLMKDRPIDELLTAVRQVAAGKSYLSAETTDRILTTLGGRHRKPGQSPLDRLSDRERHVLSLIGKGLSTREIAGQLDLSIKTIESHVAHIKDKLGVRHGRELLRLAVTWADRDGI